jgi:hypothetical protein
MGFMERTAHAGGELGLHAAHEDIAREGDEDRNDDLRMSETPQLT